jgi:hypothetical protein
MTAKSIGPTFAQEIKAAGLIGLPFAWGQDGNITYGTALTADQTAAIEAVYAAHDPTKADNSGPAEALLAKADTVMHRIVEAVALGQNSWTNADVVAWVNYRRALRAIISGAIGNSLPTQPPYPQGT